MPPGSTITEHLQHALAQHARRDAIEEWPTSRRLTYAQLDDASAALAARLSREGVGPGSLVPLVMPRSAEFLIAVVAILRCGAAYAPIDPAAPRRHAMLDPLGSPVVLGHESGMLDPASVTDSGEAPWARCTPQAPAYVMYTSGTTGTPKGVVVPHRAVTRLVVDTGYARFGHDQRWGVMSAVAFDASTLEIWGALLHGGCCVVQTLALPSLDELAQYLTGGRVTDTWLTASLFNALIDERPNAMAHMGQLLTGGERESVPHVRRFKQACPNVTLIHGYGPTENTTFSLCHTITSEDARGDRIPIGSPIHGSTMRIIEPGAVPDAPASPLTQGELLVGGLGLALGYLNDQVRTNERFVTDSEGARWYRTGDLVRLREDGAAVFIGRVDRQVKIRGHRVEPDGIETELAACEGVSQGTIAVAGDTAETRRMVAFFVPRAGATTTAVRQQLLERVPPTMMPELFIAIDTMPIGVTGKADRAALLARLDGQASRAVSHEASDTESRLITLFTRRLSHAVGPKDRFQDVGGHSLLAMRLAADVRGEFGVALPAAEILRRQTIREIARVVDGLPPAEVARPIEASDPMGDIRRRASLEHARDATGHAMLVHHAWHVSPAIDALRLRDAWLALLDRHDALRTGVAFTEAGPTLVAHDPHASEVFHAEHVRLRAPDGDDASVRASALRAIAPGDPPARMHVWPIADGSQFVMMVFHHAAIDEWSLEIITGELDALLAGSSLPGPEPYASFVRAEHAMRDDELARDLARRIASGPPATAQPPAAGPQSGQNYRLNDPELTIDTIDARAMAHGVAPAAFVAAAFGMALREWFGPPGRWIMTPVARRPSEALQRVVGCCLDMRLLEADGPDLPTIATTMQQQLLAAQEDRTLPLELVIDTVRRTSPERAGDATRFGLTYRRIDDTPRPLGSAVATPIDIEQPAARFGLCLHVERRDSGTRVWLEASREHLTPSTLEPFAAHLTNLLLERDATGGLPEAPVFQHAENEREPAASLRERHELAQLWFDVLGVEPSEGSDFFHDGGTSLLAMRLAAAVHKRLGRRLMLNQFLRSPTLNGLANAIRNDTEHPFAEFSDASRRDDRTDEPWCVAIPGSAGRAIDLYRLWHEVGTRHEMVMDMLAFDLATIAVDEASTFDPDRFFARFTALTHAYAMTNNRRGPITLMGYSLGGLVALDMARQLGELGHTIDRVVLLDAYAPPYLSRTPSWYLGKLHARLRRSGSPPAAKPPAKVSHASGDAHAAEASRTAWRAIHQRLAHWKPPELRTPVVLLRSGPAWKHVRPVRYSSTNGLGASLHGPVDIRVLDVEHLAMLTTGADRVAAQLLDSLVIDRAQLTREPRESPPSPIARHRS